MNVHTLAAEIVSQVRAAPGESAINLETTVANKLRDAALMMLKEETTSPLAKAERKIKRLQDKLKWEEKEYDRLLLEKGEESARIRFIGKHYLKLDAQATREVIDRAVNAKFAKSEKALNKIRHL